MRTIGLLCLLIGAAGLFGCNGAGAREQADLDSGAPLRIRVNKTTWRYPEGIGVVMTSPHYRIFASTENEFLLSSLPGFLEGAYGNYQTLTGLKSPPKAKRLEVYMLATRQEWVHLTEWVFGKGTLHQSISAGGYCYKGVGVYWDLRGGATLSVASHEGLHQFLYHRLKHRIPTSIEEGLCVGAEGFHISGGRVRFCPQRNPSRLTTLRKTLLSGKWTPAGELLPMDAGDVVSGMRDETLGWYAQVWALATLLQSDDNYRAGLERMIADAEAGRLHEGLGMSRRNFEAFHRRGRLYNRKLARRIFEHYITDDLDAFERRYIRFARDMAGR